MSRLLGALALVSLAFASCGADDAASRPNFTSEPSPTTRAEKPGLFRDLLLDADDLPEGTQVGPINEENGPVETAEFPFCPAVETADDEIVPNHEATIRFWHGSDVVPVGALVYEALARYDSADLAQRAARARAAAFVSCKSVKFVEGDSTTTGHFEERPIKTKADFSFATEYDGVDRAGPDDAAEQHGEFVVLAHGQYVVYLGVLELRVARFTTDVDALARKALAKL